MKNTIIVVLLVCALAGLTSITAAAPFADDYDFNYPDLYQKLTEKGLIDKTGELVEKRPHDR